MGERAGRERLGSPRERVVEPRPAATVIVARAADPGVEVVALRRGAGSRFAPGFVVFPGGVIDAGDAALAARLFGNPSEAPRACALRELYEETGFLVTASGLKAGPAGQPFDALSFAPPHPSALAEVARWIAPEFLEVRFDARFFAVAAPPGLDPSPDGTEIEHAWWARPAEVLAANAGGDAPLMWPTLVTFHELARCETVDDVLGLRVAQRPPPAHR